MHQPFGIGKRILYGFDRILELYSTYEGSCAFLLCGKELLVELKKIGKIRTVDTYRNALGSFERFLNDRTGISLEDMDSNLMIAYESWLKGTGVCPNTSSYYMRDLRAIYNRTVEQGFATQQNPFKHVYTSIDKTKKRAVSLDVIREIRDLDLTKKSLTFARDIFLFSFYTRGMSFVDMAFLKRKTCKMGFLLTGEIKPVSNCLSNGKSSCRNSLINTIPLILFTCCRLFETVVWMSSINNKMKRTVSTEI